MPSLQQLPPEVVAAIQRGQIIEAIKLLRALTGTSPKEAKDAVDGLERPTRDHRLDLSPGEVPPSNDRIWLVVLVAFVVAAIWYFGSR